MRAGKLRHRVRIQFEAIHRDESGDEVRSWETLATCWAEITPVSGREMALADSYRQESVASHRLRLRYRTGIEPTMRVLWPERNRTFLIESILEYTPLHELVLLCYEAQGGEMQGSR